MQPLGGDQNAIFRARIAKSRFIRFLTAQSITRLLPERVSAAISREGISDWVCLRLSFDPVSLARCLTYGRPLSCILPLPCRAVVRRNLVFTCPPHRYPVLTD